MLGLPDSVTVCLFDLDGVLTDTASVHRRAWKQTFDPIARRRGQAEFTDQDYVDYVDGKPRADGVRDFLASRGIDLPEGRPDDRPGRGDGLRRRQPQERAAAEGDPHDGVTVYDGRAALPARRPATPGCTAASCPRAPTPRTCCG